MPAKNRKFQARLGIETLESRQLMAGDVRVSVTAGDLVISGDNAANSIEVRQVGIDRFEVSGRNATKVNGATTTQVFRGVFDDVRIGLGGNADTLNISGKIPDHLLINGNDGNDYINANRVTANSVKIDTGRGRDEVVVQNSNIKDDLIIETLERYAGDFAGVGVHNTKVGDLLKIDLYDGNDSVYVHQVATDRLMASLHGGNDYLSIRQTTVKGSSDLDGGTGTDGLNRYLSSGLTYRRFDRYTTS